MSADILPFIPRRDRKREVIASPASRIAPDDLVMDHVDTAPCEYVAPEEGAAVFIENINA